ncbi:thiamine pyrophosphate-dependent enzyme, partial [Escherichia coli]|uniref:thiamine pyrophosphate-dependent enzyme n=1 Tax=Escherichia coli TaxID=562 RepID=UPI001BCB5766
PLFIVHEAGFSRCVRCVIGDIFKFHDVIQFAAHRNIGHTLENINSSEVNGYGVDHVKVAEGLGCKAIRVFKPEDIAPAFEQA